jgi:hypothetical protein
MNKQKCFSQTNKVRLVLCAALLGALTGCVGYVDGPRAGYYAEPSVVVVQDDYVYYPSYGVYYNSGRHQYAYLNNGAWVTTPAPYGVTADVLLASPSVNMDWHDSPEKHHAEMLKQYPKNWKSSGERHDQDGDRKAITPDGGKRTPEQTRPPNN